MILNQQKDRGRMYYQETEKLMKKKRSRVVSIAGRTPLFLFILRGIPLALPPLIRMRL